MLDDLLNTPIPPSMNGTRGDWSFTQEWNATGDESTITANNIPQLDTNNIADFIRANGGHIPDGYTAEIVASKFNPTAWVRTEPYGPDGKKMPATTKGAWSYTFRIHKRTDRTSMVDDLLKLVNRKPTKRNDTNTDITFVYAIGDTQIGKSDGDGTPGILARWTESLETARRQWIRAGKPPVLIAGLGDHLEGNQSQNGRNWYRTELTITEQLRVFRRMLLKTIDTFIEAPRIDVGVVNGNHDDVQRFQATDASDGHASESAIAVAEAIALNPDRYGHVHIYVPGKNEDHIVLECGGTNFILIHGHQWTRGKAMEWWEKQTFNNHPAGAGHILLHGHEHEFQISSRRDRLIICTPSLESESTWFKHKAGAVGKAGVVTFITKPNGHFEQLGIT